MLVRITQALSIVTAINKINEDTFRTDNNSGDLMSVDSGAVVTIGIFLLIHLCGSIWWASKMHTTLEFVREQMRLMVVANNEVAKTYVTAIDHTKDIVRIDKEIDAIWKRVNEPHACPNKK
jgi:hypothetical protein